MGMLKKEAEACLEDMFQDFTKATNGMASYPLTDLAMCRAFANSATKTMSALRSPYSPLPPIAMILAMIRICQHLVHPPVELFVSHAKPIAVPRHFAYEVLDRLRAEISPTYDFATDQVSRIVGEAWHAQDDQATRRAFRSYRMRHSGALYSTELDALVRDVWHKRYPQQATVLEAAFLSAAA